jgi:hypothetical protein
MQWRAIGQLCNIPFNTLYGLFARWTRLGLGRRAPHRFRYDRVHLDPLSPPQAPRRRGTQRLTSTNRHLYDSRCNSRSYDNYNIEQAGG